jgi:dCTP deaminase
MILSLQTLRARSIIVPWTERTNFVGNYSQLTYGGGPAGYDVRVDLSDDPEVRVWSRGKARRIFPDEFFLASTMEQFRMDTDVLGVVHDKSTWIRRGLAVHNTVIEPGWRGYLTLEIKNVGHDAVLLEHGAPIAQIVFHQLDQPTCAPYKGKYQDQERGPQGAK